MQYINMYKCVCVCVLTMHMYSFTHPRHIAESHSSTSSSSTTRTSTRASRSTPHVSNPPDAMAAVKAFQSSERCQAVHTLQALIVGSANGVFPLLEHDDRSCFTLSGLFANVHLKAKDGKAAEDWRLGIKAALNAQVCTVLAAYVCLCVSVFI
jgi:hypothetical protein